MPVHLLESALRKLFNEAELRAYFGRIGLRDSLPGGLASFELLCHEAACALDRRGRITSDLLEEPLRRAGNRAEHIDLVGTIASQVGIILVGDRPHDLLGEPVLQPAVARISSVTVHGGNVQIGDRNVMTVSSCRSSDGGNDSTCDDPIKS